MQIILITSYLRKKKIQRKYNSNFEIMRCRFFCHPHKKIKIINISINYKFE